CGRPAASGDNIHTACGLLCHEAACLWEHVRECETCLAAQQTQTGFTDLFWECRCEERYHNPECPACQTLCEEGMPASLNMVFTFAVEWQLDESLVAQLRNQHPNIGEFAERPFIERCKSAARLEDDSWLESAYEDRFGGLDF
ncbi:MAG: hypothetical protein JW862_08740, partial [Anaerolineales bacterium]|nr:hypothetical protein [Anaerolineales bacterium]